MWHVIFLLSIYSPTVRLQHPNCTLPNITDFQRVSEGVKDPNANGQGLSPQDIATELCSNDTQCLAKFLDPKRYLMQSDSCFEHLGCIKNKIPWISPRRPTYPPDPPKEILTEAIFYSRKVMSGKTLTIYPKIASEWTQLIDPKLKTTVITHGLLDSGQASWIKNMSHAILNRNDENVIALDWEKGAGKNPASYLQVVGNIRVVAAIAARFLKHVGIKPQDLHLIGHSLGAHTSAYIARKLHGQVYWITGLDAAGPLFQGYPPEVKLMANDATFVDAVHSNVGGLGTVTKDGICDFYLNVGIIQPACLSQKSLKLALGDCNHQASYLIYTSAIENPYCLLGSPMSVATIAAAGVNTVTQGSFIDTFRNHTCGGDTECVPMGLETINYKSLCQKKPPGLIPTDEGAGTYVVFTS